AALVAEEQPVLAGRTGRLAVEQEGTERRNAGAGADHDDWRLRILRQAEAVRLLHIDLELLALADALAKEGRGDTDALALADDVTHGIHRQRQLSGGRVVRRGDRIEPRMERLQRLDEGFGMRPR